MLASQVLYDLSHAPQSLLIYVFFRYGPLLLPRAGLILQSSHITGITDIYHITQTFSCFLTKCSEPDALFLEGLV
jgi:hypothetical protein